MDQTSMREVLACIADHGVYILRGGVPRYLATGSHDVTIPGLPMTFLECRVHAIGGSIPQLPHRVQIAQQDLPENTGVGCHFLLQEGKVKSEVTQSCPTLRDPMDCSLPGSSIHGIF